MPMLLTETRYFWVLSPSVSRLRCRSSQDTFWRSCLLKFQNTRMPLISPKGCMGGCIDVIAKARPVSWGPALWSNGRGRLTNIKKALVISS